MCGIFGLFVSNNSKISPSHVKNIVNNLFRLSESRGKEAAGIALKTHNSIYVLKEPLPASSLIKSKKYQDILEKSFVNWTSDSSLPLSIICHSRLVTNGQSELNSNNQPVIKDGSIGVHNGIIVNDKEIWVRFPEIKKQFDVDTEAFLGLFQVFRKRTGSLMHAAQNTFETIRGSASVVILFDDSHYSFIGTNTGSLFLSLSKDKSLLIFASEKYILKELIKNKDIAEFFDDTSISQVKAGFGCLVDLENLKLFDFPLKPDIPPATEIPESYIQPIGFEDLSSPDKILPLTSNVLRDETKQAMIKTWERLYSGEVHLKRCTRCLLPETLPFITFDEQGVCNHCRMFAKRGSQIKGEGALEEIAATFRRDNGEPDCLLGFSGGRDSSYGLYYIKNTLKLNPITFIYDWGMVTDLARRNQARVCGNLGIEQIVISADIKKKRENIRKNLEAWLKKPDLGMVPILMAGDKEFYHYFHTIREENNIKLFIFCGGYEGEEATGIFKLGFCGVNRSAGSADAEYRMTGISFKDKLKMMLYYAKNFLTNPSYINSSIFDTLFAFYASYLLLDDYVYLFNYLEWDEETILTTIRQQFDWEQEQDTIATWRTDDGTAAIYNYIYLTMAGFTEFDVIRSHQIREGKLKRDEAMKIVREENKPRFDSIEWYAQVVSVDANRLVSTINRAPRQYSSHTAGGVP